MARLAKPNASGKGLLRSVMMLTSGNVLAMAIPILAAPILGRLYSPTDYAALAQYMAFASILVVVATLQFQQAIVAEKSLRGARQAAVLCIAAAGIMGVLSVPLLVLGWLSGLQNTATGPWFAFLPLSVALSGVVTAGTFMANRLGNYGWLSFVPVVQVAGSTALSIWLGLIGWGSAGLLTAYLVGQAFQIAAFGLYLSGAGLSEGGKIWPLLPGYARRHWRFPAFTLPSGFLAQFNMQVPIFALTLVGADSALGSFARARQLVSMPVTALGKAASQVFRREGAEAYRKTGNCRPLMIRTALWLFAGGLVPCILFILFAPALFTFYLGPDWGEAGELARLLAPMLLLRLVTSPLTTVFQFTGHQANDLTLMALSAVILLSALSIAWVGWGTAYAIVTGFSIGYGIIYSVYFLRSLALGRK